MRFHHTINGIDAGSFEAADPRAAVDAVRAAHVAPDEGGHFSIVVSSDEGVVSDFEFFDEPAPHLRKEAEAREAEADNAAIHAAYRAALRAEIMAEMEAEKSK